MNIYSIINEHYVNLDGTVNTRDLGGYKTINGLLTRNGVFYRSDSLSNITQKDIDYLVNNLKIKKSIDLRSDEEIRNEPSAFEHYPAVQYLHVPISLNTMEVTSVNSLYLQYIRILEEYKKEIGYIFAELSTNSPAIVSCAGGKDRTGIVSALLLGISNVESKDIVFDYYCSKILLEETFDIHRKRIVDGVSTIPLYGLECRPETMKNMINYIKTNYHSFHNYLFECGLSSKEYSLILNSFL